MTVCHSSLNMCGKLSKRKNIQICFIVDGTEFEVYCLERDEEMIQNLVHIEEDFWKNHVQAGVIPAPDSSKLADKVLAERAKADNYRISWKASQRTDLDSKRMKAEEPEIYDRFKRTSISRRFVVRAA